VLSFTGARRSITAWISFSAVRSRSATGAPRAMSRSAAANRCVIVA
jgi:hypothetical protein